MIIEMVLSVVYELFNLLTTPINLPDLPSEVGNVLGLATTYTTLGTSILGNYVNLPYLLTLLGLVVAVEVGIYVYNLVLYLLHKIPFLNVK